uniref:Peroxisomal membrane protein PEX14-like KPWE domain-containing protein n=1 Tax=Accipiter nisus TaxID=211598 RepID=A0A8B9MRJ6_9AVES
QGRPQTPSCTPRRRQRCRPGKGDLVLRLIQNGQEPPGLRHPRASPTGDSPTASRLPPPTKPWENRSGSLPGPQHGSEDRGCRNVQKNFFKQEAYGCRPGAPARPGWGQRMGWE